MLSEQATKYPSNEKFDALSSGKSSNSDIVQNDSSEVQPKKKKKGLLSHLKIKNIFEKIEDRPTPKEVYNYRVYLTAIMASAAAIIIGYDSGFIGGAVALPAFQKEFGLDVAPNSAYIISNVISVFHVGCFFGALFSYPASYYLGRRIPLIAASLLITLGSGVMLAADSSRGLGPIYAGRVLAGLSVGCSTNLTVVYISEISPPAIRGQLTASYEIGWRVGDLVGFWINYGVDSTLPPGKNQWFIPFAIQLIPSGLFLIGSLFMKESPRWLMQVGRDQEAIKNLCWFRQLPESDEYIIYEVNQCKESIDKQRQEVGLGLMDPFYEVFFHKLNLLYRLFITVMLFIFCNFMGIQAINYYSPKLFKGLGIQGTNASLFSTGMFGVVKFVCTFIYILFVVDSFGRRKAFMFSSSLCSICFWYIGAYLKINDPTKPGVSAGPGGKAAIGMMYIWIASFITAWSGGPFVVGSEVFDQNIRSFVQAINAAMSWVAIFVMSRWTQNMIQTMQYGIYFFFASLAVISVPFVYFLLPETKGIALEDMDKLFNSKIPARKAHKIVLSNVRHETEEIFHENHERGLFKMDTNKPEVENVEDIFENNRRDV
ncbi:qutD [Candida oxycetoniae]|uniref:Quinate transporter n=1 Tax=Candida oxycetoniae TaxID=497107 RepID=A0AAI9SX53_9ASCO|nr:qutD [Candida oxycetoniae]KAI3404175.2 qutD [Candida oxycetoniae]